MTSSSSFVKVEACNWIKIFSAFLALVLVYVETNFS